MGIKIQLPYNKVWVESSFVFEDKERKYPESFVVAVEHINDGGTETMAFCQVPFIANLIADVFATKLN
jgi:hypothetical protein